MAYTQREFSEKFPRSVKEPESIPKKFRSACSSFDSRDHLTEYVKKRMPILDWMPKYQWKTSLLSDIMAGLSVAIFHVPQGMAFAMLSSMAPYHGIYMGIFPVIVYAVFGSSPHASTGSFAVILLMVSNTVERLSSSYPLETSINNATASSLGYSPLDINTSVAVMVGIWQILLGILQCGRLTVLLCESLVGGFICGATIHVITSQLATIFGLTVTKHSGVFKLIFTWVEVFQKIADTNIATLTVGLTSIAILLLYNSIIKPHWDRKMPCPIPIELFVVISATTASYYMDLNRNYGVKIAGIIPEGLPSPALPAANLMLLVLMDSLLIAIVAYVINFSAEQMFANQQGYKIDATQEFYAHGLSNVFGGIFLCGPASVALGRMALQVQSGGKTQMTGFFTAIVLIIIMTGLAPYLTTLPNPVLAAVVIVSLKSMILSISDMKNSFSRSFMDGMIWNSSFFGVILLDIDYGIGVAILSVIVALLYNFQKSHACLLGVLPGTQIYVDTSSYPAAVNIPGTKIFQYSGGLHFGNKHQYKKQLLTLFYNNYIKTPKEDNLILDCSCISFIDCDGAEVILEMVSYFTQNKREVSVVVGTGALVEKLDSLGILTKIESYGGSIFPTVHQAATWITRANQYV